MKFKQCKPSLFVGHPQCLAYSASKGIVSIINFQGLAMVTLTLA